MNQVSQANQVNQHDIRGMSQVTKDSAPLNIYFLDKREVMDPPTHTLLRMTELVLTLNSFVFNGEHYKQIGGVAMGSKLGPNYACLSAMSRNKCCAIIPE